MQEALKDLFGNLPHINLAVDPEMWLLVHWRVSQRLKILNNNLKMWVWGMLLR